MSTNKILIIAPHPDDELINCGARISKAIFLKEKTSIIYVNQGQKGSTKATTTILNEYGIKNIYSLEYKDKELINMSRLSGAITRINDLIKKIKPDEIYIPAYEGGHVDHDLTHLVVAFMPPKNCKIFEYTTYHNYFTTKKFFQYCFGILFYRFFGKIINEDKMFIPSKKKTIYCDDDVYVYNKNLMLNAFVLLRDKKSVRNNYGPDLFRELLKHDYSKPPHKRFPFKLRYETSCRVPFWEMKCIIDWMGGCR